MQQIAKDVSYSESAFVTTRADGEYDVRYFSPEAEVPFCGHATIATAVALAERDGARTLVFHTQAGTVPIETSEHGTARHADERRAPRRGAARGLLERRCQRSAGRRTSSTPSSRRRSPTPAPAT